jgi:DNA-binding MarR family transcriptional regulator
MISITDWTLRILKLIADDEGSELKVRDLALRARLSERRTFMHLRRLEAAQLIVVDRSFRPHCYALSIDGKLLACKEDVRVRGLTIIRSEGA